MSAPSPSPPSVTTVARPTSQSSPRPASLAASCAREPRSRARARAGSVSSGMARHRPRPRPSTSLPHQTSRPQDLPAFPPPPPLCLPWWPVCQPPPLRGVHRSEASTAPTTTTTSPVSWKPQSHTSDPQTAALEATIAAQQLQIQELTGQLQATLVRLSSPPPLPTSRAPAPPQPPSLAVEPMSTASSAASSRAFSPNRCPQLKRRSPSSDPVAPEHDVIRQTTSFLEAFEKRFMARFAQLEERVASIDTRKAAIESHLTTLDTRFAALETRQSATQATVAHLSLPAPLTPAPTPTLSGDSAIHHGQTPHAP
ncbi:mucin-7-like [Dermacentor albipictus]|uniref:mucin-7-like n=1 Tax=Dermacentor albipictus TaxID=60249 RepID=UPI0031FE06FB